VRLFSLRDWPAVFGSDLCGEIGPSFEEKNDNGEGRCSFDFSRRSLLSANSVKSSKLFECRPPDLTVHASVQTTQPFTLCVHPNMRRHAVVDSLLYQVCTPSHNKDTRLNLAVYNSNEASTRRLDEYIVEMMVVIGRLL